MNSKKDPFSHNPSLKGINRIVKKLKYSNDKEAARMRDYAKYKLREEMEAAKSLRR